MNKYLISRSCDIFTSISCGSFPGCLPAGSLPGFKSVVEEEEEAETEEEEEVVEEEDMPPSDTAFRLSFDGDLLSFFR